MASPKIQIRILNNDYLLLKENQNDDNSAYILGFHRKKSLPFLIKKFPFKYFKNQVDDIRAERKFTKEFQTHQNLVEVVLDNFESVSNYYFIEEYCYLGSIDLLVQRIASDFHMMLSSRVISVIIRECILGLQFLFEKNIRHEPLQMRNIMVTYTNFEDMFAELSKIDDMNLMKRDIVEMQDLVKLINFIEVYSQKIIYSHFSFTLFEDNFIKYCKTKLSLCSYGKYNSLEEYSNDLSANLRSLGMIAFFLATGERIGFGEENFVVNNNIYLSLELVEFINNLVKQPELFNDYDTVLKMPFLSKSPENFEKVVLKRHANESILKTDKKSKIWGNFINAETKNSITVEDYYGDILPELNQRKISNLEILCIDEGKADENILVKDLLVNPDYSAEFSFTDEFTIYEDYLDRAYQNTLNKEKVIFKMKERDFNLNMTFFAHRGGVNK